LGLVTSDVDSQGRVRPEAPAVQLYNLATDPGQSTNVAAAESRRAAAMQKRLDEIVARPKSTAKPQSRPKPAAKVAPKQAGSLKPTPADVREPCRKEQP
jgi:hypothetical protein